MDVARIVVNAGYNYDINWDEKTGDLVQTNHCHYEIGDNCGDGKTAIVGHAANIEEVNRFVVARAAGDEIIWWEDLTPPKVKKYRGRRVDDHGNVITGYEQVIEADDLESARRDYEYWLREMENLGNEISEDNIRVDEITWE